MTTDTEIVDAMARVMEKVSLPGHNFNSKIFAANALAVAKPMIERELLEAMREWMHYEWMHYNDKADSFDKFTQRLLDAFAKEHDL